MDQADEAEFEAFVAARSKSLLRVAWLLTGDWQHAEDLLQTALAKTYLAWPRLRAIENAEAYVRRVLATTHATWWRRRWRHERPTYDLPDRPDRGATPGDEVPLRDALGRALAALPARQRAVVVLRYYADLSEAETAATLGCSIGTVKSQTARALGKLRAHTGLEPDRVDSAKEPPR